MYNFHLRFQNKTLQIEDSHIRNIILWAHHRISKLSDLVSKDLEFIWVVPTIADTTKFDVDKIELFKNNLMSIDDLKTETLNGVFKNFCKDNEIKFAHFMKTLRYILSGLNVSISINQLYLYEL